MSAGSDVAGLMKREIKRAEKTGQGYGSMPIRFFACPAAGEASFKKSCAGMESGNTLEVFNINFFFSFPKNNPFVPFTRKMRNFCRYNKVEAFLRFGVINVGYSGH